MPFSWISSGVAALASEQASTSRSERRIQQSNITCLIHVALRKAKYKWKGEKIPRTGFLDHKGTTAAQMRRLLSMFLCLLFHLLPVLPQAQVGVEPTAIVSPVPLIQYYSQDRSDHTLCGISGGQYSVCPSTDAPYVYERIEVCYANTAHLRDFLTQHFSCRATAARPICRGLCRCTSIGTARSRTMFSPLAIRCESLTWHLSSRSDGYWCVYC